MRFMRVVSVLLSVCLSWLAAPAGGFETLYQRTFSVELLDYASGNGAKVAVGSHYGDTARGNVLTSVNGTDWQQIDLPEDVSYSINAVTFFNGRFIAAAPKVVYTSLNGLDWSKADEYPLQLNDLAVGGNLLLGVGSNGSYWGGMMMKSGDGVTWLPVVEELTFGLNAVVYGTASGTFAAVGNYGDIYTYHSGSVIKRAEIGYDLSDIAYGNGTFVAVGSHGAVVTSSNSAKNKNSNNEGTYWTLRTSGTTEPLSSIAYGNGTFVAAGVDLVLTSPDGITWTRRSFGTPASPGKIRFDGGKFVAVGNSGLVLTSPDGISWTTVIPATPGGIGKMASSGTMIVATGSSPGTVLTSPDGTHWTARYLPDSLNLRNLAFGNELFVGIARGSTFGDKDAVVTSPDGIAWTRGNLVPDYTMIDIAFGNNIFVIGTTGDTIFTSTDGIVWTPRTVDAGLSPIIFKDGKFIAIGGNGAIFSSSNGSTWEKWIVDPNLSFAQLMGGMQTSAMLNDAGVLFTSSGYKNWRYRPSPFVSLFQPMLLGFGNNTFLAGDRHGIFYTSPDGRTWNQQTLTPLFVPYDVLFVNDTFIFTGVPYYQNAASSYGGVIYQSAKVAPLDPPAPVPEIRVLPAAIDYGSVKRGASLSKTITVTNTWTGVLSFSVEVKGANTTDYPITGGSCGLQSALAPDDSCTIEVTFRPTTAFTRTAAIVITSNDPQTPTVTIPLTGNGVQPIITPPSPLPVNMGTVVFPQWAAANVVVWNKGNDTLQVTSATLSGSSEFTVFYDACTGVAVRDGSFCAVMVLFIPESTGTKSATVTINSNDPDHPVLEIPIVVTVL